MRFAFMSFSTPKETLARMAAAAKEYGYDGVEPRIGEGHAHGVEIAASPAERAAIRKLAADSGIALCCVATSCHFANPADADAQVAEARQAIDLAADVGSPAVRVFGGVLPAGFKRYAAIRLVARSLLSIADQAANRGVTVCLETHDDWSDPAYVAEVMLRVSHPAVAVNWDFMHPCRAPGATVEESFSMVKPWIRHVHLHDGKLHDDGRITLVPAGRGDVDVKRAIELLERADYGGFVSGEWIAWEPAEIHLPRELAAVKGWLRAKPAS